MQVKVNGAPRTIPAACTVGELVKLLALPVDRVAVERNSAVVMRKTWDEVLLAEGDQLEIVTFVGGG